LAKVDCLGRFLPLLILPTLLAAYVAPVYSESASFAQATKLLEAEDYSAAESVLKGKLTELAKHKGNYKEKADCDIALSGLYLETLRLHEAQRVAVDGLQTLAPKLGAHNECILRLRLRLAQADMYLQQYKDAVQIATDLSSGSYTGGYPVKAFAQIILARAALLKSLAPDGERLANEAINILDTALGPGDPEVLTARGEVGLICAARGKTSLALSLISKAADGVEKRFGAEHPRTADSLVELAAIQSNAGDDKSALSNCQKAMAIYKRTSDESNPNFLGALQQCGDILSDQNQNAEAEKLLQQALAARMQHKSTSDAGYPDLLCSLGSLKENEGNEKDAEKYFLQAVDVQTQVRRPEALETARTMTLLAACLSRQDRYEESAKLYSEAIAIASRSGDYASVSIAYMQEAFARLCMAHLKDQLSESNAAALDAVERMVNVFGSQSKQALGAMKVLQATYTAIGDFKHAVATGKDIVAITKLVYGAKAPETAASLLDLSAAQRDIDAYEEARQTVQEAINVYKNVDAEISNETECYIGLGLMDLEQNKPHDAHDDFEKALSVEVQHHGENSPTVGRLLQRISSSLGNHLDDGDSDLEFKRHETWRYKYRLLEFHNKTEKPDDPQLLPLLEGLYAMAHDQGGSAEKILVYKQYVQSLQSNKPDSTELREAMGTLTLEYQNQKQFDAAIHVLNARLEIALKHPAQEDAANCYYQLAVIDLLKGDKSERARLTKLGDHFMEWRYEFADGSYDAREGRLAEALSDYKSAAQSCAALAPVSEELADCEVEVAVVSEILNENQEAADNYKRAIALYKQVSKGPSGKLASACLQLATLQERCGKKAEAAELCKEAFANLGATKGLSFGRLLPLTEPTYDGLDEALKQAVASRGSEPLRELAKQTDDGSHDLLTLKLYNAESKLSSSRNDSEYLYLAAQSDRRQQVFLRRLVIGQIEENIISNKLRNRSLTARLEIDLARIKATEDPNLGLRLAQSFDAQLRQLNQHDTLKMYRGWLSADALVGLHKYGEAKKLYFECLNRPAPIPVSSFEYRNLVFATAHSIELFDPSAACSLYQRNTAFADDIAQTANSTAGSLYASTRLAAIALRCGSDIKYVQLIHSPGAQLEDLAQPSTSKNYDLIQYHKELAKALKLGKQRCADYFADCLLWLTYVQEEHGSHADAVGNIKAFLAAAQPLSSGTAGVRLDEKILEAARFCQSTGEDYLERNLLEVSAKISHDHHDRDNEAKAYLQLAELALAECDLNQAQDTIKRVNSIVSQQPHGDISRWQRLVSARIAAAQGNLAQAATLANQSADATGATDSVKKVEALLLLTDIELRQNQLDKAKAILSEAVALGDGLKTAAPIVRLKANLLAEQAKLSLDENEPQKAISSLNAAEVLLRSVRIVDSPSLSIDIKNLETIAQWKSGNLKEARELCLQGAGQLNDYCIRVFPRLSFSEQSSFVSLLDQQTDMLLTFCTNSETLPQAWRYLSAWKGLLIEGLREQSAALRSAPDRSLALQVLDVRSRMARDYTASGSKNDASIVQLESDERRLMDQFFEKGVLDTTAAQKPDAFTKKVNEAEILEQGPGKRGRTTAYDDNMLRLLKNQFDAAYLIQVGTSTKNRQQVVQKLLGNVLNCNMPNEVQRILKSDEAVIDAYLYTNVLSRKREYAAIAVGSPTSEIANPQIKIIGSDETVDAVIKSWLSTVTHGQVQQPDGALVGTAINRSIKADDGASVTARSNRSETDIRADLLPSVWSPIERLLPSTTKTVWLSCDGELARIPWNSIAGQNSDKHDILVRQIDSPRELYEWSFCERNSDAEDTAASSKQKMLLIGGLRFAEAPELPATVVEIDQIAKLSKANGISVVELENREGTRENVLKSIPNSQFVHIATHGYFNDSRERETSDTDYSLAPIAGGLRTLHNSAASDEALANRNMLLRSGLLLAERADEKTAGKLTDSRLSAAELAGLDLTKCRLMTLSACESGRGKAVTGQGVIGLRASAIAAGAHNVLMSLWSVDDVATERLMTMLYTNMETKKMSPSEALRQAQLELRQDPQFSDPYYWAAWVIVGRD
jgi:CHAT domain-containing protein/tetratricopeptide (TPR) repeat protein